MSGAWDAVAGLFGFGEPSGNDHGSSNWAAWGHAEIRSMLDTSVDLGDIGQASDAWRKLGQDATDLVTGLTLDLNGIVTGGWRGTSADAAITALPPIDRWSASVAEIAERTTALMDASGSSAAQAKAAVPPPKSHNWGESLLSFGAGGPVGAAIDAVVQEREQSEAHAEAVRIMSDMYSAPINDYRDAVPTYPQLVDPTLQPPDQPPNVGPAPSTLYSGTGRPVTYPGTGRPVAYSATGRPVVGAGAHGGGHVAHSPPAAATLQGVSGAGPAPQGDVPVMSRGGTAMPDQATQRPPHGAGQVAAAAAAAGVPVMAPFVGSSDARRAGGGGLRLGGGRTSGLNPGGGAHSGGLASSGHAAEFGPRPSNPAEIAEGRMSASYRGAAAAGRAGVGDLMAPMGTGSGKGSEDSEHRRPSYLIEMDDIFTDGRKVAPAVIGEDPPEPSSRQ